MCTAQFEWYVERQKHQSLFARGRFTLVDFFIEDPTELAAFVHDCCKACKEWLVIVRYSFMDVLFVAQLYSIWIGQRWPQSDYVTPLLFFNTLLTQSLFSAMTSCIMPLIHLQVCRHLRFQVTVLSFVLIGTSVAVFPKKLTHTSVPPLQWEPCVPVPVLCATSSDAVSSTTSDCDPGAGPRIEPVPVSPRPWPVVPAPCSRESCPTLF